MKYLFPLLLSVAACAPVEGGEALSDAPADPSSSKADNWRSPIGQEYSIEGDVLVRLSGEDSDFEQRIGELARAQVDSVTQRIDAKLWELWPKSQRLENEGVTFILRLGTPTVDAQLADEYAYRFHYSIDAAGPIDLLDRLPVQRDGDRAHLPIELADGSTVDFSITPVARTPDSYPEYLELFDGGLDIGIMVGGDYNDPRYDLPEARALYSELVALGLRSPVANFEALRLDSGALTGSIDVSGQAVPVRARLVHADMGDGQVLIDAYKDLARTSDIVIFRGHASRGTATNSGAAVYLEFSPAWVSIEPSEFRNLDLPDQYQIFMFDGCHTYAAFAEEIYAHERKDETNADIITSVNYGSGLRDAATTVAFLRGLLAKRQNTWQPLTWNDLLKRINDNTAGDWTPIYGVHGLEDNPRLSPLARLDTFGQACTTLHGCPGGSDNLCLGHATGATCSVACADDSGCPNGSTCHRFPIEGLGEVAQCY